jgi:hypothetical protein
MIYDLFLAVSAATFSAAFTAFAFFLVAATSTAAVFGMTNGV